MSIWLWMSAFFAGIALGMAIQEADQKRRDRNKNRNYYLPVGMPKRGKG